MPRSSTRSVVTVALWAGLAGLAGLAGCATPGGGATARRPPNVVLILVDDLGWRDLGCYGNAFHETPNIDALAAGGMLFTNAYANAPNCAPTRACIMSGQYTPRHGVYTVGSAARGRTEDRRLVPTPNTTTLADEVVTLPEALRSAGYVSASIGKWHLGDDPTSQGFDLNVGGGRAGHPRSYFSPYRNRHLADGPEGEYLTDRLAGEAVGFIERNASRPFFLYFAPFAVHTPIQGRPDLVAKYRQKRASNRGGHPGYAAMVEGVDEAVGRVVAALDEAGVTGDTLLLLFSDNGGHGRYTSMAPLRGSKGMLYEGGIREPLIGRWPGRIPAGARCDVPVVGVDLFPTILDLTGASTPSGTALDGESLVPVLTGAGDLPPRPIFWHFPAYLEGYGGEPGPWRTTPAGAVRLGDHKLIEFFEDGSLELYDLVQDPGETTNLVDARPERAEHLHRMLVRWRTSLAAPSLVPNPDYRPAAITPAGRSGDASDTSRATPAPAGRSGRPPLRAAAAAHRHRPARSGG